MSEHEIIYQKIDSLVPKLNLFYFSTLILAEKNDENDNNSPINKLLFDFEEIQTFLNNSNPHIHSNLCKFLYFNRIIAHDILYQSKKIIHINNENKDDKLDFYLFLSLLIEDTVVVNYSYSIDLIKKINALQTLEKEKKIKKIILAKIILILIKNYYQINDNEENINNEFEKDLFCIKNYNLEIINKNINALNIINIKEDDILYDTIEEIYTEIIKNLIIQKKLDGSHDSFKLIEEINLKSLNLTKKMFDELKEILDKDKDYIKEYIITKFDDIFDIKILHFYNILLNYIIKSDFYIFQIPFLFETRDKIKKIVKENINKFYPSIKNNQNFQEIEQVLKAFIEYEYYLNKSKREGNFELDNQNDVNNTDFFGRTDLVKEKEKSGRSFEPY